MLNHSVLTLENITLRSYDKIIFNNLSASFAESTITYLQGQNGSGKTSLLRIIAGIIKPSAGQVIFDGINIDSLNKPYVNYIGHKLAIKTNLTVIEMIKHYAVLFNNIESIDACIYYLGMQDILDQKCGILSHGNLKKLAMSRLLLLKSDLWLLDEIESNLDKDNLDLLHKIIISKV